MTQEEILIWSLVGGFLGATFGVIAGIIGVKNSRRMRNGEESWWTLSRWNSLDWFNFFLVVLGFTFWIAYIFCEVFGTGWVSIRNLLSGGITFLGVGAGSWMARARALMKKGS